MCASLEQGFMSSQRPHLLVVDDDRAVLTLAGTGVTCLDILRALRSMSPQCEAVLTTGYTSLDAAVDAVKGNIQNGDTSGERQRFESARTGYPASLVDVERDHIIRTLEQVGGNKAVAARILGISRRAFYRQLERHGLHQRIPMPRRPEAVTLTTE
jgi:DNA-binding NtrC family response regulator